MRLGIGSALSKSQVINPTAIPGLVLWINAKKENLYTNVEGTTPVTADGDYIGQIKNLAPGDANGNKLGSFLRRRANSTGSGGISVWSALYKEGGANGQPYLSFPTVSYAGYSAGVFGNLDGSEDMTDWGGISATQLSNLQMGSQNITTFAIVQPSDDDDSEYMVLGTRSRENGTTNDGYFHVSRTNSETYRSIYLQNGASDIFEIASSGTYADTNLHYIRTVAKAGTDNTTIKIDGTVGSTTDTMDENYPFDFNATVAGTANVFIGHEPPVDLVPGSFGGKHFEGKIYEVLVYAGALSDANIAFIETYLSNKYGVTV